MLLSIALILLCGMSMSWICKKLKLPGLLGMLLTGIVLGPYVLNLLDENILNISSELRKMALIIILMRAGLGLDISGLKKIGRPAVMMCFVPASFELLGMLVLAPRLLGLSLLEAAILGSVLAAVSPAVVVPRMVKLMEEGYRNMDISIDLDIDKDTISEIRTGATFGDISKNYNIPKRYHRSKVTEDIMHKICKMRQEGVNVKDMCKELGLGTTAIYRALKIPKFEHIRRQYNL